MSFLFKLSDLIFQSIDNGHDFNCQHGPGECTMNRVQSCALDMLNDNQTAQVEFVICHMSWTESIEQVGHHNFSFSSELSFDFEEINKFYLLMNVEKISVQIW